MMDKDILDDLLGKHAVEIAKAFDVNPRRLLSIEIQAGATTVEYLTAADDVATITRTARPNIRRALGDM